MSISRPLIALAVALPATGLFSILTLWYGYDVGIAASDTALSAFLLITAVVAARSVLTNYFPQSGKVAYGMGMSLVEEERYRSFL